MKKKTEAYKALEKHLAVKGIKMSKKISSGVFLRYDNRKAYSMKDIDKLTDEGFFVNEDIGIFIWNALT